MGEKEERTVWMGHKCRGSSKSKAPQKLPGGGGLKTNKGFQNEGGGWTADGGSGSNPNDESES